LYAHVHRNAELRMDRALHGVDFGCDLTRLVLELVDGVAGMMPEKVVGPAPRFTFGIHIGSAEEKRLHHKMLKREFTLLDPVVNPLMAGIETPRVTAHGDESGFLL